MKGLLRQSTGAVAVDVVAERLEAAIISGALEPAPD